MSNDRLFISHSNQDKPAVRRLAMDLRRLGINVWLDEQEIGVGESISAALQEGLRQAKWVAIWLTPNAVKSGWVEREWQSKLADEIATEEVVILPLLAKNAEVPVFLRDKRYADFRSDYEQGLQDLLKTLGHEYEISTDRSVLAYTEDILSDLSDVLIYLPLHRPIRVLTSLKSIPRTGKRIRLDTYKPPVKIRSICDHILSVAHSADCLWGVVKHGIHSREAIELARCIAYHDVCEVILGDIPAYTNRDDPRRSKASAIAQQRLGDYAKEDRERITNEFIAMYLGDRERQSLHAVNEILADNSSALARFHYVLDRLDPIIAVWRYLDYYRGYLDKGAGKFLKRLRDFFENPQVKRSTRAYREDGTVHDLALAFQDRSLAGKYYKERSALEKIARGTRVPLDVLVNLIEGRGFEFADKKAARGRKSKARSPKNHTR